MNTWLILAVSTAALVMFWVWSTRKPRQTSSTKQPNTAAVAKTASWSRALQHTRHRLEQIFSYDDKQQNEAVWRHIEEVLIAADIGVHTTQKLLQQTQQQTKGKVLTRQLVLQALHHEMLQLLQSAGEVTQTQASDSTNQPQVWLFVGVNGAGKTTTIGKLAYRLTQEGKKVVIAAGDTFRAAAVQQLQTWAQRANAIFVSKQESADPSAVLFEAVTQAKQQQADLVLCDTAGRLHNHQSLMDQLNKMHRVLGKACAGAPHESILVLDATIGQNGVMQAKQFNQAVRLTGAVMTKLDGTAKGGVLLAIANELQLPIRYVGLGEAIADLQPFDPQQFVNAVCAPAVQETAAAQQEQEQQPAQHVA